MNNKKQKLFRKLANKEYRDAWGMESIKTVLPFQIQAIRQQRDWSQEILGNKAGMKQTAISRLENAEGNLSINTLLRLASAFDCALMVRFVPFSKMVSEVEDVSREGLEVTSFAEDYHHLEKWSDEICVEAEPQINRVFSFAETTQFFLSQAEEDIPTNSWHSDAYTPSLNLIIENTENFLM